MPLPAPVNSPAAPRKLGEIEDKITELAAHIHAATFRLLELIREFDEREGWGGPGLRSCAHWPGSSVASQRGARSECEGRRSCDASRATVAIATTEESQCARCGLPAGTLRDGALRAHRTVPACSFGITKPRSPERARCIPQSRRRARDARPQRILTGNAASVWARPERRFESRTHSRTCPESLTSSARAGSASPRSAQ